MLEVNKKYFFSPLTLVGCILLLDQHFACTAVLLSVWGLVCLSAGNGKCHVMKSCHKLTTLSCGTDWIKHQVLLATFTNLSNFFPFFFWKHQPLFSLCSLLAPNLAFPLFLTPLIHIPTPSTRQFIYLFIFTMALILALWPSIPPCFGLYTSVFTPAQYLTHPHHATQLPYGYMCIHTYLFLFDLFVCCLVLFSPLSLNFGR